MQASTCRRKHLYTHNFKLYKYKVYNKTCVLLIEGFSMNKIILLLSFGLICLMGMASVSAVDVDDCAVNDSAVDVDDCVVVDSVVNDSAVCVSDVDAYEYAEDNASHENCTSIVNCNDDLENGLQFQILSSNLQIQKKVDGKKLDVKLIGKLDIPNTPAFESILQDLDNVQELTLDFKDVSYISSASLRVLISMQKVMIQHDGSMKLINVPDDIMDVFDITGFSDILTIEQ